MTNSAQPGEAESGLNRTNVELKQFKPPALNTENGSLNRTNVELKQITVTPNVTRKWRLNRTNVELKPSFMRGLAVSVQVLIEPMWN